MQLKAGHTLIPYGFPLFSIMTENETLIPGSIDYRLIENRVFAGLEGNRDNYLGKKVHLWLITARAPINPSTSELISR